jgi:hypothetical protein
MDLYLLTMGQKPKDTHPVMNRKGKADRMSLPRKETMKGTRVERSKQEIFLKKKKKKDKKLVFKVKKTTFSFFGVATRKQNKKQPVDLHIWSFNQMVKLFKQSDGVVSNIYQTHRVFLKRQTYMSNVNPLLDDFRSLLSFEFSSSQNGTNNTLGEGIELRDGSTDRRSQMFIFFFIPSRPNAAQAVVRHYFFE